MENTFVLFILIYRLTVLSPEQTLYQVAGLQATPSLPFCTVYWIVLNAIFSLVVLVDWYRYGPPLTRIKVKVRKIPANLRSRIAVRSTAVVPYHTIHSVHMYHARSSGEVRQERGSGYRYCEQDYSHVLGC